MKLTNTKINRLKLKELSIIALYNTIHKKVKYYEAVNSLIKLRHLYYKYPERRYHDEGIWIPVSNSGQRHPHWAEGIRYGGKK